MRHFISGILALFVTTLIACTTSKSDENERTTQFIPTNVGDVYCLSIPEGMEKDSRSIVGAFDSWKTKTSFLIVCAGSEEEIKQRYVDQTISLNSKGDFKIVKMSQDLAYYQHLDTFGIEHSIYYALIIKNTEKLSFFITYFGVDISLQDAQTIASSITLISDSTTNSLQSNEFKKYISPHYEISYPCDWDFMKYSRPQEQGDFYAGHRFEKIGFSVMRIDMREEGMIVSLDEAVTKSAKGWKFIGWSVQNKRTKVNGYPAYKSTILGNDGLGDFKRIIYTFIVDDVLYTLQFGGDINKVDDYQDTFEEIIKSFKIK